jgi:hypothetical protein
MSIKVDASKFNAMLKELSRVSGVGIDDVIRSETASVLQKAMSLTKAAEAGKIRARYAQEKISKLQMDEKLRRRGLAKQSWLALAEGLGFSIKAPGYVAKATVKGTAYSQKVSFSQSRQRGKFTIHIANSMITMIAANGKGALAKAINGRTGYFRKNLKNGIFGKWKEIAKRYPGMRVSGF